MRRWVALAPLLLVAGCLARVERTVIPIRDSTAALKISGEVLEREGFVLMTRDRARVRTAWKYTDRRDGDAFLYYRYVVDQDSERSEVILRIEVIRCLWAPREGADWNDAGCATLPPRVPLWAKSEYERIEQILRGRLRSARRKSSGDEAD